MADFGTFVGGSYKSQSPVSDNEELINWLVEQMESPGATATTSLFPTPGFQLFTLGNGQKGRAMFNNVTTTDPFPTQLGRCFAVFGSSFDEVLQNSACVQRGTVEVDEYPATICTNGYGSADQEGGGQLLITSGGKMYILELRTTTFTEVLDLTAPADPEAKPAHATQGACINGRFLIFDRKASRVYFSKSLDGTVWAASDFIERSIGTDPWRSMIITPYNQILLAGTSTSEVWYFNGEFPSPFAPDLSGQIAYGNEATFSASVVGDSVMWLGKTPDGGVQVIQMKGYQAQRASTHAMEYEGAGYPRLDDAIGQSYTEQGHTFYLLTFPSAGVTWCYDTSAPKGRQWHRRGTWISEQDKYIDWGPTFHAFAFGKHLMADRRTNRVYEMSNRFPLDVDGRVIRRLRRSPTVQNENQEVIYKWFELLMETGLGQDAPAANVQGPPPVVMLRVSNDGGRTWGDERQASAGALGAYSTRVYWSRLGQGRQRVFEVTVSDVVRNWRVTAAYLQVVGGDV